MSGHSLGDHDDDITDPDCLTAILANATLQFAEGARHLGVAVPLLWRLQGNERAYLAGRLAEDIRTHAKASEGLAELVEFIAGKS